MRVPKLVIGGAIVRLFTFTHTIMACAGGHPPSAGEVTTLQRNPRRPARSGHPNVSIWNRNPQREKLREGMTQKYLTGNSFYDLGDNGKRTCVRRCSKGSTWGIRCSQINQELQVKAKGKSLDGRHLWSFVVVSMSICRSSFKDKKNMGRHLHTKHKHPEIELYLGILMIPNADLAVYQ